MLRRNFTENNFLLNKTRSNPILCSFRFETLCCTQYWACAHYRVGDNFPWLCSQSFETICLSANLNWSNMHSSSPKNAKCVCLSLAQLLYNAEHILRVIFYEKIVVNECPSRAPWISDTLGGLHNVEVIYKVWVGSVQCQSDAHSVA